MTDAARVEEAVAGTQPRRNDVLGWSSVAVLTVVVAVSWLQYLNAPFGDNHFGRVGARYALHIRNLYADGLTGSSWSANWRPYTLQPYAHHPPLLNVLDALVGLVPGEDPYQVMLAPHLLALLAIPAGAFLLRELAIRWVPTLLGVGAMTATGYYIVHSPIMFDIGPILLSAALVVRLRRIAAPSTGLVVAACATIFVLTFGSWPGIVIGVLLVAWLLAARRADRAAVAVTVAAAAGLAGSLAFMFGIHGWQALADQYESRTSSNGFGWTALIRRQWGFVNELVPIWYVAAFPFALVAGIVDRRTRTLTAASAVVTLGWVFVLRNGSYAHEYWGYLVLVPGLLGMGALADRCADLLVRRPRWLATGLAAAAVVIVAVSLVTKAFGPFARERRDLPADAGRLVSEIRPPDEQRYAWQIGEGARWLAYYWNRPVPTLEGEALTSEAPAEDIVFVDLASRPAWLPATAGDEAMTLRWPYAIFDVGTLRELHAAAGASG